jgi:hypothetical protein
VKGLSFCASESFSDSSRLCAVRFFVFDAILALASLLESDTDSSMSLSMSDVKGVSDRTDAVLLNTGDSVGVVEAVEGVACSRARRLVTLTMVNKEIRSNPTAVIGCGEEQENCDAPNPEL